MQLENPPEYHQECKFQRLKHTRWEKTDDFTQGQAQLTRYEADHFLTKSDNPI